jgi:hypothetical protein
MLSLAAAAVEILFLVKVVTAAPVEAHIPLTTVSGHWLL